MFFAKLSNVMGATKSTAALTPKGLATPLLSLDVPIKALAALRRLRSTISLPYIASFPAMRSRSASSVLICHDDVDADEKYELPMSNA